MEDSQLNNSTSSTSTADETSPSTNVKDSSSHTQKSPGTSHKSQPSLSLANFQTRSLLPPQGLERMPITSTCVGGEFQISILTKIDSLVRSQQDHHRTLVIMFVVQTFLWLIQLILATGIQYALSGRNS